MKTILVIAPHPDDETLGCGGTILRHIEEGDEVIWVIATRIDGSIGFSDEKILKREKEIQTVKTKYGISKIYQSNFLTTMLDTVPKKELVNFFSNIFKQEDPEVIYIPYRNDAHSDHAEVFDAATSCAKSFRYDSIKSVYVYETLSETGFGLRTDDLGFKPNLFVDITDYLQKKIDIMCMYENELGAFPFPRSIETIESLAKLRGSYINAHAAEAFMVLKEVR